MFHRFSHYSRVRIDLLETYKPEGDDEEIQKVLLWDRKAEGGFPGSYQILCSYLEPDYAEDQCCRNQSAQAVAARPH
jgi:predicted Rdx family selenoprotein